MAKTKARAEEAPTLAKSPPPPVEDYLFGGALSEVDPETDLLIAAEAARETEKLIFIASESICPRATRAALTSAFGNIYAEGYPSRRLVQRERRSVIAEHERHLAFFRRYSDRRFYKGTELCDLIEALAQQRVAEAFATDRVAADDIFVNVQPLSGAAANNAVYTALCGPGDTIMGLALPHGGHLSHGSPWNRSGQLYRSVSYEVDRQAGRLVYDDIERAALHHKPRVLIAGASAYPWTLDWARLRAIADQVPGCHLLADIAHPAGLVVAGLFPNPVGHAHVVTFTTHKTLCGPRGAVIVTTDPEIAKKIDRGVFPGEQGGPHLNSIAAIAVALRIAKTEKFARLQRRIVENARALAEAFRKRGLPLAYGGTDSHLLLVDLRELRPASGVALSGQIASNILDLCGIVTNKNTVPGDEHAGQSSALRFGTTFVSQRGLTPADMDAVAGIVDRVLRGCDTFEVLTRAGWRGRARVDLEVLERAKADVAALARRAPGEVPAARPDAAATQALPGWITVRGERARAFLEGACSVALSDLEPGQGRHALVLRADPAAGPAGRLVDAVWIGKVRRALHDNEAREEWCVRSTPNGHAELLAWFRALSDGYVRFDGEDIARKLEGPVVVADDAEPPAGIDPSAAGAKRAAVAPGASLADAVRAGPVDLAKPWFIGQRDALAVLETPAPLPAPAPCPQPPSGRKTPLHPWHRDHGGKLVDFAGWEMPVLYKEWNRQKLGIFEEHRAVRAAAGLFDVAHMGTIGVTGPHAERFLDLVTTNYVCKLRPGASHYTYVLGPDGVPLDDIIVYRRGVEEFLLVVNASNHDKVLHWFRQVNGRACAIDADRPWVGIEHATDLEDLKDPAAGDRRLVDLAFQGPASLPVLRRLASPEDGASIAALKGFQLCRARIGGIDLIVSRSGYTGEPIGYELMVHPDASLALWGKLLEAGADLGVMPAGLGARDSTRTEAGFPLYGHELEGPDRLTPFHAGYGAFVKWHKPFFVGRDRLRAAEAARTNELVRFVIADPDKKIDPGDVVTDRRGRLLGKVTSACSVDGAQIGLALVDRKFTAPGTKLAILPARMLDKPGKYPVGELGEVAPRFLTKKRDPRAR